MMMINLRYSISMNELMPVVEKKMHAAGFGLGLNFVQQVIEAHKGKIIVNSVEGEFTEFIIYLPLILKEL